jgi:hypothetical protein
VPIRGAFWMESQSFLNRIPANHARSAWQHLSKTLKLKIGGADFRKFKLKMRKLFELHPEYFDVSEKLKCF